jgi:transposase
MHHSHQHHALTPVGLILERVDVMPGKIVAVARSQSKTSGCPSCGTPSGKVHSQYQRSLADLPSHGRAVEIELRVRRFRCPRHDCPRRIFAERLDSRIAAPFGRRTARMEYIVHHLGLALGGRPAHGLARRLSVRVSKDTLLRVVRRHAARPSQPLRAIGIDDFAWRRGCRYGTVICDLERRRIVALLPDRQGETAAAWLRDHPGIGFIARDRGASYGEAASKGAPQAIQVADRWHLVENASAAFLDAVRQHLRPIRELLQATAVDPAALTYAERRQWRGYQRRKETVDAVLALAKAGSPIKQIARRLGMARLTVRRILRGGGADASRSRTSILEPHLETLDRHWRSGCRNATELWRRLRGGGFDGCRRVVAEWTKRRRLDEASTADQRPRRLPSARIIARLLTTDRERIPADHAVAMTLIQQSVPTLVAARDLLDQFQAIVRGRKVEELDSWIAVAQKSALVSFASGIAADRDCVRAALVHPWSNGQTEGQITKLKLVKRQMYGRGKRDLLEARLIKAA